jgi:phage terminase small subunit
MAQKLTQKQEDFCLAYIETGNATEAYRRAYKPKTSNQKSLWRMANRIFDNVKVQSRLDELRAPVQRRAEVDAAYVLQRLKSIDEMDITEILNDNWTLKPLSEWPKTWRTYLSSFDVQELRAGQEDSGAAVAFLKKIKWPDKLKNIELLGKHVAVNAFKDSVHHSGEITLKEMSDEDLDRRIMTLLPHKG